MISRVAVLCLTFAFCVYTSLAQTPTTSYKIGRNGMATPIVINFLADNPLPTVSYYCNNLPGICANIAARLGPGVTNRLVTYDSDKGRATSRRRSSNVCGKAVRDRCAWQGSCDPLFQNFPEMWPTSCDEFPFASTIEGGPGFVGPNNANQVRARRQCVPSREQSQQGRLEAILATLFAAGSAQNYRNDGLAHRYVVELDYGVRLDPVTGLADLRYHGRVTSGGATPPPVGTPFRCAWTNPGPLSTCNVFSQKPRPLPAQMPNNGYQANLKYQGRQYNCPKAATCATPPFVPRGIDEELFVSFNASQHTLDRRQTSCPAPEPLDTPAQAAAAVAATSVAAAALAELSADAALLAALIAARRLIDEIQNDVDVVQQVVAGSLPSSQLATAIESAAAALSEFDNYIFVNDTSEDNQDAQDIMNGIDDAATDAYSFMLNVMSIMNDDIPDDDGSFGATVLVPGDVSTTSVAPTTTFVESVTPPPPPPTTTDELPAPTAGDNSFGHLIRRSYADMSDVTDGALAHATVSDCPNAGSALSTLLDFSNPSVLEKVREAAVVSDLRKRDPSLLPNLALTLPTLKGRQTQPCVNCSVSEYNTLYCSAAVLELSIEVMYSYWTDSDSAQFSANVSALAQDVDLFLGQSSSFIASNDTSNAEYRDASDIWHYLDDHHSDSGFYPS